MDPRTSDQRAGKEIWERMRAVEADAEVHQLLDIGRSQAPGRKIFEGERWSNGMRLRGGWAVESEFSFTGFRRVMVRSVSNGDSARLGVKEISKIRFSLSKVGPRSSRGDGAVGR
jgi:hypothetical protein